MDTMKAIAEIDVSSTMAFISLENGYVRPTMVSESRVIDVKGGRHPVIEKILFDRNANVCVIIYLLIHSFFFYEPFCCSLFKMIL